MPGAHIFSHRAFSALFLLHIRSFWIRRGKFSGVACSHKVDSWPSTRRGNDDRCPHYEYLSMELVGANKPSLSPSVNNEVPRRVASNLENSDGKEVDDWPLHYLRRIKILLKFEPLWTMGLRAWGAREGSQIGVIERRCPLKFGWTLVCVNV